jgi:hypothetical protein
MPYFPFVESPGEMLTTRCLKLVHCQGSELTMSYPRERCLQIPFPQTMCHLDVIPQDVLGCQWNDVKAPQGIRLRVNLKSMLALRKIMQNWVSFFSLSFKTLDPQTFSAQIIKTLQLQEAYVHECFNNLDLKVGEVVN